MSEFKVVPVGTIRDAMDALELYASDTLAGTHSANELRMVLLDAPAVQAEPVAWLWVKGAYRTVVAKDFADELIEDGEAVAPLYTVPLSAEQKPLDPSLAFDASVHLTNWLDMDWCECEGAHTCGYNEVKRTRDALLAAAEQHYVPDVQGEPVAYAVHAGNGNIRIIWCADPIQAETLRQEYGEALHPLYTAPLPAEQQPRSDALIVGQTDRIAALLAKAFQGSQLTEGVTFRDCENPKAKQCWDVACHIQEELTATDVENALAGLEDEQQPAPDVSALVEALEWLRGAINCTPENDKHRSSTWISSSHPRIKQIDKILAAYREGGE